MSVELLIVIGIFGGGIILAQWLAGAAMQNLEKPHDAPRDSGPRGPA